MRSRPAGEASGWRAWDVAVAAATAVVLLVGVSALGLALGEEGSAAPYVAAALLAVCTISFALAIRSAARQGAVRQGPGEGGPGLEEVGEAEGPVGSVEAERAASQDLLEIDRFVRRLHAALAAAGVGGEALRPMLAEGARFDLAGGGWWPQGEGRSRGRSSPDGAGPAGAVRFRERSRTVHLVADVAIVVSTCEVELGSARSTAVHALQLQRSRSGWLLRELLSRNRVLPVSERTTDPRPPSAIGRDAVAGAAAGS